MFSDDTKGATRSFLALLIGAGVALALAPTDLQAQEVDALTVEALEEALSNPDAVLDRIRDGRGSKEVWIVKLSSVAEQKKSDELQQRHGDAVESFRKAARDHSVLTRALEAQGVTPEDVVAIQVGSPTGQQGEEGEGERREMAVHEIMYVVVSGDAAAEAHPDSGRVNPSDSTRHDDPGSLR